MTFHILSALERAALVDPTLSLSYIRRNQEEFFVRVAHVNQRLKNKVFKLNMLKEFFKRMPVRNDIYTITSHKWPFDEQGCPNLRNVKAFNNLNFANGIYVFLADKIGMDWRLGRKK